MAATPAALNASKQTFRILRDDSVVENPAVNFISTQLRAKRVAWFHMPYTVPEHDKFYHHKVSGVYQVRDIWFYTHSLLEGFGREQNADHKILMAIRSLQVVPEFDTHRLIRAQVNCVHRTQTAQITPPHRDFDAPGCVYIYYANDSDGDTILFDDDGNIEAEVTPSAGHLVRMDSRQWHCQTTPIRTERRFVINLNFEER